MGTYARSNGVRVLGRARTCPRTELEINWLCQRCLRDARRSAALDAIVQTMDGALSRMDATSCPWTLAKE